MTDNFFDYRIIDNIVDLTLKISYILVAIMLVVYSFIVLRQIFVMKNTVETSYSSLIIFIGLLSFFLSLSLLFIFFVIL